MASTILVDKIDPQSGTALEIGTSGDTITVPSGATFNVAGTLQSGGAAVVNTPAFLLESTGNTSISDNTWTKLTFAVETLDTDSACTDSKFTVPSGEGGVYQINFAFNMGGATDGNGNYIQYKLHKNGVEQTNFGVNLNTSDNSLEEASLGYSSLISLSASDYIEVYGRFDTASGSITTAQGTFSGMKIIGA